MKKEMISISESKALDRLLQKNERLEFIFEFPAFDTAQNRAWEQRVKQDYFACGCDTGTLFLFGGVMLLVCFYLFRNSGISLADVLPSIALLFSAAVAGKWIGIKRSEHALKKKIREIKLQIAPVPA